MNVNVDIDFDAGRLGRECGARLEKAIAIGTSELRRCSQPYVRFLTGATAKSAYVASDITRGLLVYDTPYAHYAYTNERSRVTKDHNPNATEKWAEVAWKRHKDSIVERMEKEVLR